jgi:hypothetical protein
MGGGFPDDPDRRTKLDVAKDCLLNVCKQLGPTDRMSVITFNHETETILPTDYCTPRHISKQAPPSPLLIVTFLSPPSDAFDTLVSECQDSFG